MTSRKFKRMRGDIKTDTNFFLPNSLIMEDKSITREERNREKYDLKTIKTGDTCLFGSRDCSLFLTYLFACLIRVFLFISNAV